MAGIVHGTSNRTQSFFSLLEDSDRSIYITSIACPIIAAASVVYFGGYVALYHAFSYIASSLVKGFCSHFMISLITDLFLFHVMKPAVKLFFHETQIENFFNSRLFKITKSVFFIFESLNFSFLSPSPLSSYVISTCASNLLIAAVVLCTRSILNNGNNNRPNRSQRAPFRPMGADNLLIAILDALDRNDLNQRRNNQRPLQNANPDYNNLVNLHNDEEYNRARRNVGSNSTFIYDVVNELLQNLPANERAVLKSKIEEFDEETLNLIPRLVTLKIISSSEIDPHYLSLKLPYSTPPRRANDSLPPPGVSEVHRGFQALTLDQKNEVRNAVISLKQPPSEPQKNVWLQITTLASKGLAQSNQVFFCAEREAMVRLAQ